MRFALLLLPVFMGLLLLGCTKQEAQAPTVVNPTGEVNPPSGILLPEEPAAPSKPAQVVPELPPSVQPETGNPTKVDGISQSSSICSIELDKLTIVAGETVGITARASAGAGEEATYSCADEEKTLGINGLFNHYSTCKYPKAGTYDVWVKINGDVCARQAITVLNAPLPPKFSKCNLIGSTQKKDFQEMYFETGVNYSGYLPNDTLKWECGWRNFQKQLGNQAFGNDGLVYGIITVSCRYTDYALIPDKIKVKVGEDSCGEMVLKQ